MISIIIPAYNSAPSLPRSIESVIKQSFSDLEIIVVDDGSTDDTSKVVASISEKDKRIKYVKLMINQGVHAARNKGIESAVGDFLVFLDADDVLYSFALQEGLNAITKDPAIGMITAPFYLEGVGKTGFKNINSGYIKYERLLCGTNASKFKTGFVLITRKALGNIRFVMQNLDFIFYRKIAKNAEKMYYLSKPLGVYHMSDSKSALHNKRKIPNKNLSIKRSRKLVDFLSEFGPDILKSCPKKYSPYAYGAAVGLLLDNKKKKAVKYAFLSYKYSPKRVRYAIFLLFALLPLSSLTLHVLFYIKKMLFFKD